MYPEQPENSIIVYPDGRDKEGFDLFRKFKMFLIDGYTVDPPEPKTYIVDIPGGNGSIDLTDAMLGECAYSNRKQEFTFYIVNVHSSSELEQIKTKVHNYLHGRAFDYIGTIDPDYTYHGRFTVSDLSHERYANVDLAHQMKISIESKPFKHKETQERTFSALGGTEITFKSGRELTQPVFTTDGGLKVIFEDKEYTVNKGTYKFKNIVFREGNNDVYVSSYPSHSISGGDLKTYVDPISGKSLTGGSKTDTTFGFNEKKLYEGYKVNGTGKISFMRGIDVTGSGEEVATQYPAGKDLLYSESFPVIVTVLSLKGNDGDKLIVHPEETDPERQKIRGNDFPYTDVNGELVEKEKGKIYSKWIDMLYKEEKPIEIKDINIKYEGGDL